MRHSIIPPYLLQHLADLDELLVPSAAAAARETLVHDRTFRSFRANQPAPPTVPPTGRTSPTIVVAKPAGPKRTISDAETQEVLPGKIVRRENEPAINDAAADEAYEALGATYNLFARVYGRDSIDGAGLPLDATVHYGRGYDNAFWDGSQMVFGDGDGEVFQRFTKSVSVIGHELTHGVTQYTTGLAYQGQAGALNESISDVFGALVEQYLNKNSTAAASWLIGVGLFTDQVQGEALRSMKAPGTAYDDDVLGKDPQPAHMDGYVKTSADHGGVHINSGIPNRAFYLVADELGGNAWEEAGQIWYDAVTSGKVVPSSTFGQFARVTVDVALARYGVHSAQAQAVRSGWTGVGVELPSDGAVRRTGATALPSSPFQE